MSLKDEDLVIFNRKLDRIENFLSNNVDLYSREFMDDFKAERKQFEKRIEIASQNGRNLNIGVIGSVKAGKSSFLNALLFDGEEILPKAATPMTAALTCISYSEKPEAVIHFYQKEDWESIIQQASEYDVWLEKEYEEYFNRIKAEQREVDRYNNTERDLRQPVKKRPVPLERFQFEKRVFRNKASENLIAAKELVSMVSIDISEFLGNEKVINPSELEAYIGAGGLYTPIVSYVELRINDKRMENIMVVDTPGLHDPIVSRTLATKKFLARCDVALLISPTTQFMDSNMMKLMIDRLPNAGVNEIMIIGSKLDSGMLDYKVLRADPKTAFQHSVSSYNSQYRRNVEILYGVDRKAAEKLSAIKPLYVSSLAFSIYRKATKTNDELTEEELNILKQFKNRFNTTNPNLFHRIAGIDSVKEQLNEIIARKEQIIREKNSSIIETERHSFVKIINDINETARSSRERLTNDDVHVLKLRYEDLCELLERSRIQIGAAFEIAAAEAEKTAFGTQTHMQTELSHFTSLKVTSEDIQKSGSRKTGFLGLKTENYTETIVNHRAEVSETTEHIHGYIGKCRSIIDKDFELIVDKSRLSKSVKESVIKVMQKSGGSYTEADVLEPLNAALYKIKIPHLSIKADDYIDEINSNFPSGVVKGDAIHKLSSVQAKVLTKAFNDITKMLNNCVDDIKKILLKQADTFTDKIIKKLKDEFSRLENQMHDQELFITRYDSFINQIAILRSSLFEENE